MDAGTLNLDPSVSGGEMSEKTEKIKDVAGKAAQFAGAAGLGVAGTMAFEALNNDTPNDDSSIDEPGVHTVSAAGTAHTEEITAESVTEFDPNDIMIEPTEDVTEEDDKKTDSAASSSGEESGSVIIEPQPITMETDVIESKEDIIVVHPDPTDDIVEIDVLEEMYGGPDGWEDFEDPDGWLDDTDLMYGECSEEISDDPDVLEDLMA